MFKFFRPISEAYIYLFCWHTNISVRIFGNIRSISACEDYTHTHTQQRVRRFLLLPTKKQLSKQDIRTCRPLGLPEDCVGMFKLWESSGLLRRYLLRRKLLAQSQRTNLDKVWARVFKWRGHSLLVLTMRHLPSLQTFHSHMWGEVLNERSRRTTTLLLRVSTDILPRIRFKSVQTVSAPCRRLCAVLQAFCFELLVENCDWKQTDDMATVWHAV